VIHRTRPSNIRDLENIPNPLTHLFVGLCELNSNAQMFGGSGSDSFKIKYKHLDKVGNKYLISVSK
jgi:hypothetical protein